MSWSLNVVVKSNRDNIEAEIDLSDLYRYNRFIYWRSLKPENKYCVHDNYTYNVIDMYHVASGKVVESLSDLINSTKHINYKLKILSQIINYMVSHRDEMIELEPENGWGNYEGALAFIRTIYLAHKLFGGNKNIRIELN